MAEETKKKSFNITDLPEPKRDLFKHAQARIQEMQSFRKQPHFGTKLDTLWVEADRAYIPHRLKNKKKKVIAEDETKGWRGALVTLGDPDWQSDIQQANPFVKISVALAVLVDQNPTGVFTPMKKAFQATTLLIQKLYQRSWEYARSKGQLKLFVHNLAKYGWAVARTYPLRIEREVQVLKQFNQEDPENSEYEKKTVVEFNDIFRENLDVRNAWIDDMARPNNPFSVRDWCWRKVYTMDAAREEFGKYKRFDEFVQAGGVTDEVIDEAKIVSTGEKTSTDLVEVYFYESRLKDIFAVIINGVPVVLEPLPISDTEGNKKLSLWQTYWNLRHGQSPYGIGIYEAIRYDQAYLDRIRNMTIDQITMSIYKMFFYQGTQTLTDTGDIKIAPGVGKQVLNPKDIQWLEVPGPGRDAYEAITLFKKDVDEASGITEPLLGEITGKTAFELAQAKEAAIKRLKVPLDNILDALNDEGYITISLIQMLYSIPEVYEMNDKLQIDDYMREIQSDPELYERQDVINDDGEPEFDELGAPKQRFLAKVYPEFPLSLEKDERGNLIEAKENQFFRTKPSGLKWEGIINIKSQSVLSPSKQIDKALNLEMYNILIPLLAQPPELVKKPAEDICKLYDKDPREILPDLWYATEGEEDPLFMPVEQVMAQQQAQLPQVPPQRAQQVTAQPTLPAQPQGIVGRFMSSIANLGR